MSVILYINGQRIDTDSKTVIAQTKQVNDIANLSNRQCNFTNKIKIPKTANNVKALNYMAVPGNTSSVPYQKNECFLQSANGQVFVHKGWAVVADGGDYYNVTVYDGIIDLYKAIENKTMAELDLSAINKEKTIENVTNSWATEDKEYRYLVANYNGDTGNSVAGEINIDYLVPAAWIPYLWEQLQEYLTDELEEEVKFEGAIFNSDDFKSLYISYPKGVNSINDISTIFESSNNGYYGGSFYGAWYIRYNEPETNELLGDVDDVHLQVAETGYYRLSVSGTLHGGVLGHPKKSKLYYSVNQDNTEPIQVEAISENIFLDNIESGSEIDTFKIVLLQAGDTVCFLQHIASSEPSNFEDQYLPDAGGNVSELAISITKVSVTSPDFGDVLKAFTIKDFITEIVQRFGLTIFKNPYSQTYTFLTMEEFIESKNYEDWSDKYLKAEKEIYKIANYAQHNYMRYKYNDKESDFNDGYIGIENKNIINEKDIVKSKIYSPEQFPVTYFGNRLTNTYKLWNKEIKEIEGNEEEGVEAHTKTEYKSLDKRFYIMRAERKRYSEVGLSSSFNIISKESPQTEHTRAYVHFESFDKQNFTEIIENYYQPISKILNNSIIVSANLWLNDNDIINFDFKKLYYIKQLGNYFIVNKINNYIPGKPTKVELIRVIHGETPSVQTEPITIHNATQTNNNFEIEFEIGYSPDYYDVLVFEISKDGTNWNSTDFGISQNYLNNTTITLENINHPDYKGGYLRMVDITSGITSNTYEFRKISIISVENTNTNIYNITYSSNYTPYYGTFYRVQVLVENNNMPYWVETDDDYTASYNGTIQVNLTDYPTATKMRIKNNLSEIVSNTYSL